jgi:hypothetical protein
MARRIAGLSGQLVDEVVASLPPCCCRWGDADLFVRSRSAAPVQRIPRAARVVYQGVGHAVH